MSGGPGDATHAAPRSPTTGLRAIPWPGWPEVLRHLAAVGAALLIAAASGVAGTLLPSWGLDESWRTGLYLAHQQGLRWGSDVVFTYGPLGWVENPKLLGDGRGMLALGIQLAARAVVAWGIARQWRRTVPSPVAWALAYIVVVTVGWSSDVFVLAGVPLVAALALRDVAPRRRIPLVVAVAAAAGTLGLVKLSLLPVAGAVALGVGVLVLGGRRLAPYLIVPSAAVVAALATWLALRQRLQDIPMFVSTSLEVVDGYAGAMAVEDPARAWEYWAAAVLVPLVCGTLLLRLRSVSPARRVVVGGVVALALVVAFRLGFVRHDQHSVIFFSALVLLAAAVPPDRRTSWSALDGVAARLGLLVACLCALWQAADLPSDHLQSGPERAQDLVTEVRASRDPTALAAQQAGLRRLVPDELLATIGRGTVHVEPTDTFVVSAADLAWRPAPVFQGYAAYTPALDHLNAETLSGDAGPEWVLRRTTPKILGRNPLWDPPAHQVALLCHYRTEEVSGEWELLRRTDDRCGEMRPLPAPRLDPRGRTMVPRREDEVILATASCDRSLGDRVLSQVFKPRRHITARTDRAQYDVVPAHLTTPFIVRAGDHQISRLDLDGCASPPEIRFLAMPFSP